MGRTMATYTQENRWLRVRTPLGRDALLLTALRGREAICELFHFELELVAERNRPIAFDRLLGQMITVELAPTGCPPRFFHGLVQSLVQLRRDDTFIYYRAVMVPGVWRLTKTRRSRVFQQQTVRAVLDNVLQGVEKVVHLNEHYGSHNYCVQYNESDFDFASRLMEEEGIFYFFQHSPRGHRMQLADKSVSCPPVSGPTELLFDEQRGGTRSSNRIDRWEKSQQLTTGRYRAWDSCFQLPGQSLEALQRVPSSVRVGKATHRFDLGGSDELEVYQYPGGYAHRFDGVDPGGGDRGDDLQHIFRDNRRHVRVHAEREAVQNLFINGAGTCTNLVPGHTFNLKGHFDGDGKYLVTSVEHLAVEPAYRAGKESPEPSYQNNFQCIPAGLPYRPPMVTPIPKISGSQTATVVGPAGEEIFTDKFGRVKVQFHWDRESQGGIKSSCWLRMAHGSAGGGWGHIHLPRVGQEVIVAFHEGDPDMPYIVGCAYNAKQMPPFPLPEHRNQSGFKTHSKFGSSKNFSGLAFDDTPGSEHVQLHSERDLTHSTENDHLLNVGSQQHQHVGQFSFRQVGGFPLIDHAAQPRSGGGAGIGGGPGRRVPHPRPRGQVPPPQTRRTDPRSSPDPRLKSHSIDAGPDLSVATGSIDTGTTCIDATAPPLAEHIEQDGGSGSGGGTSSSPAFNWNSSVMGGPAGDMALNFGLKSSGLIGISDSVTLGSLMSTVINPLAWLGGGGSAFTPLGIGLLAGQGNVGVNLATTTICRYGPIYEFFRGPHFKIAGDWDPAHKPVAAGPWLVAIYVAAGLYAVAAMGNVAAQMIRTSTAGRIVGAIGFTALQEILLGVWLGLEKYQGVAYLATELVEQQNLALGLAETGDEEGALETEAQAQAREAEIVEEESDVAGASVGDAIEDVFGTPSHQGSDGLYTITAPGISLQSISPIASPLSSITIHAAGKEGLGGTISMFASQFTTVAGGSAAYIKLQSPIPDDPVNGVVEISCGELGMLTLQSGPIKEPNCIMLDPAGIQVESLMQILLLAGEESLIEMNPATGILLSAFGENNISINEAGIFLMAGETMVAITPAGIEIEGPMINLAGEGNVGIEGAAVDMEAADVSITAAAVEVEAAIVEIL